MDTTNTLYRGVPYSDTTGSERKPYLPIKDKLATQAHKSAINYLQKYSQASSTVETELIPINRAVFDLNKTHIFRFRQEYKSIPIYGSLINVEISKKEHSYNEYQIFVDSSKVDIYRDSFAGVDSSPVIQEEDLKDKLENQVEYSLEGLTLNPKLYYYYDRYYYDRETQQKGKWLLAYITDLEISSPVKERLEELVDYIIDAQTGDIVGELPRVRTFV